jgi:hypothetical protein
MRKETAAATMESEAIFFRQKERQKKPACQHTPTRTLGTVMIRQRLGL